MPVKVVKRKDVYRVVEASDNRIARGGSGKAVDSGGHASRAKAERQARAINAYLEDKKKKSK